MLSKKPIYTFLAISFLLALFTLLLEYCKPVTSKATPQTDAAASYIGDEKCQSCHSKEHALWKQSDHFKAMMPANDSTVMGDFSNVSLAADGFTSRFFKKDGKYFINTEGADGKNQDFEVLYTFGFKPLQQYLVAFPGGRMQVPRASWDVNRKKWFNQYAGQKIVHNDWLHWSGGGQNWNTMCASCHSTNLQKNYMPDADSFHTTFSVMTVSCESCHGPGSKHVEYAASPGYKKGEVKHSYLQPLDGPSTAQINTCAPCHARKADLGAALYDGGELMDHHIPEIPSNEYFHADGQVNDEDYIYTSFLQSKMFQRGVKCSNCHDPHSGKTLYQANQTCLQCHEKKYDSFEHHKHNMATPAVAQQVNCVSCHMPGKFYMGNDLRHDHSFRVPRPDLSVQYGTPNACNNCHKDKSAKWTSDAVVKWYGPSRKYHFAEDLIPGSQDNKNAEQHLVKLMADTSVPAIVKATAVHYMRNIPSQNVMNVLIKSLADTDPQVRYRALRSLPTFPVAQWKDAAAPLIADKVKAVRIAAADIFLDLPPEQIPMELREAYAKAKQELHDYVLYQADFAVGAVMIGDFFYRQNDVLNAEKYYRKGLKKDSMMNYARFNLSTLLNAQGRNADALKVLEEARLADPKNERVYYNLALLYAEMGDNKNAAGNFGKAVALGSIDPRVYYNYGVLEQQQAHLPQAEKLFLRGLTIDPTSASINYALAVFYLQQNQRGKAMGPATVLKRADPANPDYQRLFQSLGL